MKEIKLERLALKNFQKFRDFTFEPQGSNAEIRGDNGTGKTTLSNGLSWLLTDKDAQGNSTEKFSIKTTDKNDNIIHGIDHSVEAEFSVDGAPLTLKKTYRETWNKKKKTLKSHKTDYEIDGEPGILKKEYDTKIASIIPPETLRLLTDLKYFNSEKFGWKNRRKILFRLCEGLTEDALGEAEKAKKILAARKKKINEEMAGIRPRIDEKERELAALADLDRDTIQAKSADLKKQIETIKSDSSRATLIKERAGLEAELAQLRNKEREKKEVVTSNIRKEKLDIDDSHDEIKRKVQNINSKIEFRNEQIENYDKKIKGLYREWDQLLAEEPDILDVCPVCKKPYLPEEKEAVQAEFNLMQSQKKEGINTAGKKVRAQLAEVTEEKIKLEVELKVLQLDLDKAEVDLDKKSRELKELIGLSSLENSPGNKKIETLKERIYDLTGELEHGDRAADTSSLEFTLSQEKTKIAKLDAGEEHKTRIEELKEQEKVMAASIEELEGKLYQAEENIQAQARLLEGSINSKFELVKFRLFEEQMNQGIRPCCRVLVNGIEYGHGLNTGSEINAGLEIIKILGEHLSYRVPVFVDDCSLISQPRDPGCQHFKLINDKDCPELLWNPKPDESEK